MFFYQKILQEAVYEQVFYNIGQSLWWPPKRHILHFFSYSCKEELLKKENVWQVWKDNYPIAINYVLELVTYYSGFLFETCQLSCFNENFLQLLSKGLH